VTADLHKLSPGRCDYYVREVARDREEYLSGHGESPGEFLGDGSRALGKTGVCSEEAFKRLFAWRHPDTGTQLGRAPRRDAMPAWDLVLRPVKDVSVLYALGEDPGVVMDEMGHTDPGLALRIYRQAMRRDEGEKAQLRALVEGLDAWSPPGSQTGASQSPGSIGHFHTEGKVRTRRR